MRYGSRDFFRTIARCCEGKLSQISGGRSATEELPGPLVFVRQLGSHKAPLFGYCAFDINRNARGHRC